MMIAGPPAYSSLPNIPNVNALPGGVPYGPWGNLYRSAPGAQLPAVHYPGMYPGRHGMRGFGAAGVTIQGFGQGNGLGTAGTLLIAAGISAAVGAAYAMAIKTRKPIRNAALVMGGITLGTGLLAIAAKKANGAVAVPAAAG